MAPCPAGCPATTMSLLSGEVAWPRRDRSGPGCAHVCCPVGAVAEPLGFSELKAGVKVLVNWIESLSHVRKVSREGYMRRATSDFQDHCLGWVSQAWPVSGFEEQVLESLSTQSGPLLPPGGTADGKLGSWWQYDGAFPKL